MGNQLDDLLSKRIKENLKKKVLRCKKESEVFIHAEWDIKIAKEKESR